MGSEIRVSERAAHQASSELLRGVRNYETFALVPLMPALPCAGSTEHDSVILSRMREALEAYDRLMNADAEAVQGAADTLFGADERAASVLGTGGGACV